MGEHFTSTRYLRLRFTLSYPFPSPSAVRVLRHLVTSLPSIPPPYQL